MKHLRESLLAGNHKIPRITIFNTILSGHIEPLSYTRCGFTNTTEDCVEIYHEVISLIRSKLKPVSRSSAVSALNKGKCAVFITDKLDSNWIYFVAKPKPDLGGNINTLPYIEAYITVSQSKLYAVVQRSHHCPKDTAHHYIMPNDEYCELLENILNVSQNGTNSEDIAAAQRAILKIKSR